MTVFAYSQVRRNLAGVLDRASKEGKVQISVFTLCPEKPNTSPLEVKGVKTDVPTGEIVRAVRETRRRKG